MPSVACASSGSREGRRGGTPVDPARRMTRRRLMKLREILTTVEGELISKTADLNLDVPCACAADLMSDVLAFAESRSILVTGLCNPQVVRTAEMADMSGIIFVRGKVPPPETIALAEEKGVPLIASCHPMFEICGLLYAAGMRTCDAFCRI